MLGYNLFSRDEDMKEGGQRVANGIGFCREVRSMEKIGIKDLYRGA